MGDDAGNYARHAAYWDWSGHDRTEEHEYWLNYAAKYGKNVLIPMCAWGETGAYMAERGLTVTAFDIVPEMIAEGRKRYGNIPGLALYEGDVTNFRFDILPVDFCFSMDFEVLPGMEEVKKALRCIYRHLRVGGCLAVSIQAPPKKSHSWGPQTYLPLKQVYPDVKLWKTGGVRDDAKARKRYISQTLHIEHRDGHTESVEHACHLQCYTRKEWLAALKECGFKFVREHGGHGLEMSYGGDVLEAVRV